MRKHLFILFSVFFVVQCAPKDNLIKVEGIVKDGSGKIIKLQELSTREIISVDSTEIADNGKFTLKASVDIPTFMTLYIQGKEPIYLVVSPGENITLKTTYEEFHLDYIINGSFDSQLIYELVVKQRETMDKLQDLAEVYQEKIIGAEDKMELIKERNTKRQEIIADQRAFTKEFIQKNPGSLASLMALYQYIDPNTSVLDPQEDFNVFTLVDSVLSEKYPSSEAVKSLNRFVVKMSQQASKIKIGDKVPEIALPSPQGDTVLLSSIKAKYILIDFWASWCPPCRKENPNLVKAYQEYKDKGFEIYQVSLDKTKEAWIEGIRADNLNEWYHVSDLAYWDSYAARLYGITQIPSSFLIDENMRVIAMDLREEQLQHRLQELFY